MNNPHNSPDEFSRHGIDLGGKPGHSAIVRMCIVTRDPVVLYELAQLGPDFAITDQPLRDNIDCRARLVIGMDEKYTEREIHVTGAIGETRVALRR